MKAQTEDGHYLLHLDPAQSRWAPQEEADQLRCACGAELDMSRFLVTAECSDCCEAFDMALEEGLQKHGHAGGWPLYWAQCDDGNGYVSTFYGKRRWRVWGVSTGRHNIVRVQHALYWKMPDGRQWMGRVFGHDSQLVRGARRLKG